MFRLIRTLIVTGALLALLSQAIQAQTYTGEIVGYITNDGGYGYTVYATPVTATVAAPCVVVKGACWADAGLGGTIGQE